MSTEVNKALARRREIEEIWTKGNLAAAEEIRRRSDVGVDPAGQ